MIHTSAPATLMLMGEHAVLRGKHALIASTDQRLHVYLTPRPDRIITIDSSLGHLESALDTLTITPPFTFATALITQLKNRLPSGFDLNIASDFNATVGLGSSAAVLVALTYALLVFTKMTAPAQDLPQRIFAIAYESLHKIQGRGSGADLAASIAGGMVYYRQTPFELEKLDIPLLAITLVYSGYKTPTPEVIAHVDASHSANPEQFDRIFTEIDASVHFARNALLAGDRSGFLHAFRANQSLMCALGVVDSPLQQIIDILEQDPGILAAKVSGSGLGDCVLGIGQTDRCADFEIIPACLGNEGVKLHDSPR